MSIGFHLSGDRELRTALRAKTRRTKNATSRGLRRSATIVKREIVKQLSLTAHPPGTPTPSSPGQPPSLISGHLRRSIETELNTEWGDGGFVDIGPTAVYARIQELGGQAGRGSTLPPRPYVAPAVRAARGDIEDAMRDAWADAWA